MKPIALIVLAISSLCIFGCSGGEKDEIVPQASTQAATQAASDWTPEQKAAMQEALKHRRDGDGGK